EDIANQARLAAFGSRGAMDKLTDALDDLRNSINRANNVGGMGGWGLFGEFVDRFGRAVERMTEGINEWLRRNVPGWRQVNQAGEGIGGWFEREVFRFPRNIPGVGNQQGDPEQDRIARTLDRIEAHMSAAAGGVGTLAAAANSPNVPPRPFGR